MTLIVNDLRNVNALLSVRVLAGTRGLTNPVENIVLATAQTATQHLPIHEVLLMTLDDLMQLKADSFSAFITTLTSQHCSALLVRQDDPFVELPVTLITACNQQDFPLFSIPYQANDRDIFVDVTQALYTEKQQQLNYYEKINRHFTSLTQSTSRQSLLDTLAALINNPVILFQIREDQVKPILQSADLTTSLPSLQWSQRLPLTQPLPEQAAYVWLPNVAQAGRLVATSLFQPTANALYLGALEQNRELQPADFSTIDSAANFLKLIIAQQSASRQNRQANTNALIDDLLSGRLSPNQRYQNTLAQLTLDGDQTYRVLQVQAVVNTHPVPNFFASHPGDARQLIHFLKSHWPDLRYRVHANHLIFIFQNQAPTIIDLKQVFAQATTDAAVTYQGAVGSAQLPNQLKQSASQAATAANLMATIGSGARLHTYSELGFYRCLPSLNNSQKLTSLISEDLLALYQTHPELCQTLAAYIAHNLSVKNSAAALYIHPKTMSYRLSKIRDFLHTDFSNAEDLFTLNVGLHILRLIDHP